MIDQDQCGMLDTMSSDTGVCCRLIPRLSRGVSRAVSPRSRTDIGASEVGSEDISVPSWALLGPPGLCMASCSPSMRCYSPFLCPFTFPEFPLRKSYASDLPTQ